MKAIIVLFAFIGLIFITVGYIKSNQECPPPTVEIRYIPRSFTEESNINTPVMSIFGSMFKNTSPWDKYAGYGNDISEKNQM